MQYTYTIFSVVVCLALQYFSKLPHKRQDFQKKKSFIPLTVFFLFCLLRLSETLSGAFTKLRNATINYVISVRRFVCLSVLMEQLGS